MFEKHSVAIVNSLAFREAFFARHSSSKLGSALAHSALDLFADLLEGLDALVEVLVLVGGADLHADAWAVVTSSHQGNSHNLLLETRYAAPRFTLSY